MSEGMNDITKEVESAKEDVKMFEELVQLENKLHELNNSRRGTDTQCITWAPNKTIEEFTELFNNLWNIATNERKCTQAMVDIVDPSRPHAPIRVKFTIQHIPVDMKEEKE